MGEKFSQNDILAGLADSATGPMTVDGLADRLGVKRSQRHEFYQAVRRLHRDGRLVVGEDKTIRLPAPGGRITGVFQGNRKGFGFVTPVDSDVDEDFYIPAEDTAGAITGDTVEIRVARREVQGRQRSYGRVMRIISRGRDRFVGTLMSAGGRWLVETDGRILHEPILVDDVGAKGGRSGDRVVVKLTEYPEAFQSARGVVVEVLGAQGEYDTEVAAVIRDFELPDQFSADVQNDLDGVIERFNTTIGASLRSGSVPDSRMDLRDRVVITIDPVDARDYDDAISIEAVGDHFELGVHIADVAWFVRDGAPLDVEARARANSVYLPRRVLPMLPEALSNGLCSLQEGQPRLTKTAFITYDREGRIVRERCANTIICSTKRLTYEQAAAALNGQIGDLPENVVKLLKTADLLAKAIYRRREKQGMLHLGLPEVELKYDAEGRIAGAVQADQSFPHTIIEMFMVEANEAVARQLDSCAIPFPRRTHGDPSKAAFKALHEFLLLLDYTIPENPERSDLQDIVRRAAGRPESYAVNFAILRSLQKAEYSTQNIGHYALAGRHYTHFTSPIRRYIDLVIHRLLDDHLRGRLAAHADRLRGEQALMQELCDHCSITERRAERAERQLKETLILQWLSQQVGTTWSGVVSGVGNIGLFVQFDTLLIDGVVRVEELGNDSWQIDVDRGCIEGRRTGRRVKIGDAINVTIVAVDPIRRRLDLVPADDKFGTILARKPRAVDRFDAMRGKRPAKAAKPGKSAQSAPAAGRSSRRGGKAASDQARSSNSTGKKAVRPSGDSAGKKKSSQGPKSGQGKKRRGR